MFGYVTVLKRELRIGEYELYRAVYCGLCRELKKRYGGAARMTLSYDMVFLVMLLSEANGTRGSVGQGRCFVHPMKKRSFITQDSALHYAAAAGTLLAWHKADDNVRDEKGAKRLSAAAARLALGRGAKKAARDFPLMAERIKRSIEELFALERAAENTLDLPADTFAALLGDICAAGAADETQRRVVRRMGQMLGRWIYIADAFCDIEADEEAGSYNPMPLRFERTAQEDVKAFKARIRDEVDYTLTQSLADLSAAFDLLERGAYHGIIENILMGGLSVRQRALIEGKNIKELTEDGSL